MKTKVLIFLGTILFVTSALVSYSSNKRPKNDVKIQTSDTLKNNPKIDIHVNKQYDKNGNIVKYDSSYSYVYTSTNGDTSNLKMDSIFNSFKPFFFDKNMIGNPFEQFFSQDSLYQQDSLYRSFFDPELFMQQFENNQFNFEDMMRQIDSLRNLYLKQQNPGYEDAPKKEKPKGVVDI